MGRRPNPHVPAWTNPYYDPQDDVVSPTPATLVVNALNASYTTPAGQGSAVVTVTGHVYPRFDIQAREAGTTPWARQVVPNSGPQYGVSPYGDFSFTINISVGTGKVVQVQVRQQPNVSVNSTSFTVVQG
jgi:hypothetical protein